MNGAHASWNVTIELAAAASLVWAGEPFVVAEGAFVHRSTTIRLDAGASMAWRETLVLGRHGERPGSLRQEVTVSGHGDVPVLHEELALGLDTSPLLLGGARAIGSVLVLGHRLPSDIPVGTGARYELEAEGTLVRHLASDAHLAVLGSVWSAARRLVTE
jgi:urease accessory protein